MQTRARHATLNALTLQTQGGYQDAIAEWDKVIQNFPDNPLWDDAWEQKSDTQWRDLQDIDGAIQTLLDFVTTAPAHPRAAEFLFSAAQIAERNDRLEQAAQIWERIPTEYPEDERAQRALFLAGISRYRLADFTGAMGAFQRYLENATTLEERAAAHFWQGKSQLAMGDSAAANASWEAAAGVDPTGYYSERASDILRQLPPFTPPQDFDLSSDPGPQSASRLKPGFAPHSDWQKTPTCPLPALIFRPRLSAWCRALGAGTV